MNSPRRIDDARIRATQALAAPAYLLQELPLCPRAEDLVANARDEAAAIIRGDDQRLLVIVGPCSIHNSAEALDYARWLKPQAEKYADKLLIVMRTYFEKPRTIVGWKGFINDPDLDGSHKINKGLRAGRQFLIDVHEIGLPCATEFLDMTVPQYIADHISWGAIGARTTESQPHRELASGLSMPIGFKNPTDGRLQTAVEAILAAREPHWFAGNTKDGIAAHLLSDGNDTCHMILRGGSKTGPNYSAEHVAEACALLKKHGLPERVMIDCSHGNSSKDHRRQRIVAEDICSQICAGSKNILGVMIESNLVEGRQDYVEGQALTPGQSITDACIGLDETTAVLDILANCG